MIRLALRTAWLKQGLSGALQGTADAVVNLVPSYDFTTWQQQGVFGMSSVTQNSFTNQATASVSKDIGTVAGKTYLIKINAQVGSGALRIYFSEDGSITTPSDLWGLEGGYEEITLVAYGPYLTFRASVGNGLNLITQLEVTEVT